MRFDELTAGWQEKPCARNTVEDILALAQEGGYELSDEELEAVSGGSAWDDLVGMANDCADAAGYLHL